ncbi:MAG TPA: hypothetical protein VF618_00975 [Thermoanaerobaculia bacterium]
MKSISTIIAPIAIGVLCLTADASADGPDTGQTSRIPTVMASPRSAGPPLWVSASEAFDEKGASTFSTLPLPQRGDRLVFFAYFDPRDTDGLVFPIDLRNQLVIERAGALHLLTQPKKALTTLREFTDSVRAHPRLHDAVGTEA